MTVRKCRAKPWQADNQQIGKAMARLLKIGMKKEEGQLQVHALNRWLAKTLPDKKAVEVTGDPDAPLITEIRRVIIGSASNPDG